PPWAGRRTRRLRDVSVRSRSFGGVSLLERVQERLQRVCRGEQRGDLVVGQRDQVVAQDGPIGRADVFESGVPGLGERDEDAATVGGGAPARGPTPPPSSPRAAACSL